MNSHNLYSILPISGELYKLSSARYGFAYYLNYRINLITGLKEEFNFFHWKNSLDFKVEDHQFKNRIIHLFYEFGNDQTLPIDEDLLAIDIEYTQVDKKIILNKAEDIKLELLSKINYEDYLTKFKSGYEELVRGNCYQFNLTAESHYKFDNKIKPEDFIGKIWSEKENRGAYGSATYSDVLKKLFLSNSPECLFDYKNNFLVTRPIKGTLKRTSENKREIQKLWNQLSLDKKNEAELNMITDLLRNDLSSIDLPRSRVLSIKKMLLVPNLIHQYSEISVELRAHVTLLKILNSLFPGGSITGAPKKSAMKIINSLEKRKRKFYCGSTILLHNCTAQASINIRSSEICFESYNLSYSAGGGITLESTPDIEYLEMSHKIDSYIHLINR